MLTLRESGAAVRVRRMDMGLTQTALARIGGLSRATINQLEAGAVKNLSVNKLASLFEAMGLSLRVSAPRSREPVRTPTKSPPLKVAAQTASVSFKFRWRPESVRKTLATGVVSPEFEPHAYTLLDEAPVSLLASAVEQVHAQTGLDHATVWRNMRTLARRLMSSRPIWQ